VDEVADGRDEMLFGVLLFDEHYEACRGYAEFRGGRLVGLQVGRSPARRDGDGLTIGFTVLTDVADPPPGSEYTTGRAVSRVYVKGALDSETGLGSVFVDTAFLDRGTGPHRPA
jgi:hypothetical protein